MVQLWGPIYRLGPIKLQLYTIYRTVHSPTAEVLQISGVQELAEET
jgi:hypothetical protein